MTLTGKALDEFNLWHFETTTNPFEYKNLHNLSNYLYAFKALQWMRSLEPQYNVIVFSDGFLWTFDLRWKVKGEHPSIQFPKNESEREYFDSYEEALEAGVAYLNNLINKQL